MKIVDMHCDTISVLLNKNRAGESASLRQNQCHIDLERMQKSGYLLQNFALFVDYEGERDPWDETMAQLEIFEQEMAQNSDLVAQVKSYRDIEEIEKSGKIAALLTVEEGGVCKGELEKLNTLYDKGVRMMTLNWNYVNELGYPNMLSRKGRGIWAQNSQLQNSGLTDEEFARKQAQVDNLLKGYLNTPDTEHGLTPKGQEFVQRMEELGIIPDVSHMSDAGFYDVLRITHKPFAASHSNARAICPCVRNLTDDMIRALAEHGGVTGLNFCADFLTQTPAGTHNPGTISAIVEHALHIVDVGGIECLGLGTDFDGIDTHEELPGAQSMGLLWDALEQGGFRPSEIDHIFYQNVLRLYHDVL